MTDFESRLRELTHEMEIILEEDLASLEKMSDQRRMEQYNTLKANEEEFVWEFSREYQQLTETERAEIRSKFRLARLLLAASFYEQGQLPRAMGDDFINEELQAVVDFERYKRFDVLSEDEIEEKIRRMEGEVYELVTEYTSTQIANMDELLDNPDVQQDVLRKLLDRYQDRREKIRQGFFVYVETHGLEHMVESIESAVKAVSEAADERETIREELRSEIEALSAELQADFQHQQRTFEAKLQQFQQEIATQTLDREDLQAEIQRLEKEGDSLSDSQTAALEELTDRIERTSELEVRLEEKIEELQRIKQETREQARESAREETAAVVTEELEALREQREQIRAEVESLEREREQIRAARDRLEERQQVLESQVTDVQRSLSEGEALPEQAISTSMARLLEMDYIGRFDTSVHEASEIYTPDGYFEIPDGYWDGRGTHLNDRTRLSQLLEETGAPEQYPMNRRARYEITKSRFLGLSRQREMVIEATIESTLEAYATNGFDASPADLDDLLGVVNDAVYEAEHNDYHYLLAVASPTGWTDRVRKQVANEGISRSRYSRNLSLVLVNLSTGEVITDSADEIAQRNRDLFEIPVADDQIEECVGVILANYIEEIGVKSVLLEEVIDEQGFDVRVAKQAFDRLEADGQGEQIHVDDYGLALEFTDTS